MAYAELEVGIHRQKPDTSPSGDPVACDVELRFRDNIVRGECHIDLKKLRKLRLNAEEYGRALADQVFADKRVLREYERAQDLSQPQEADSTSSAADMDGLRLRLLLHESAQDLDALRWELLAEPGSEENKAITSSERVLFSRYLTYPGNEVGPRRKTSLKFLIAVAAPNDLESAVEDGLGLAPLNRKTEIAHVRSSLSEIKDAQVVVADDPLTLDRLLGHLRDGVDVLYLVCHGAFSGGIAKLFLQNENGGTQVVDGSVFTSALRDLKILQLPRLVVLASCESAGTKAAATSAGDSTAVQVPLARLLANVGVPAIVAMQGKITMESNEVFMRCFFEELLRDGQGGQIDGAMAVARAKLRDRSDRWIPSLFLRLKDGRIWYEAGFAGEEFDWSGMAAFVQDGEVTPILGWGLGAGIYGSLAELARELAGENFPLAPFNKGDLPRVSQFLRVGQKSTRSTLKTVRNKLRDTVYRRHESLLGDESFQKEKLPVLLERVAEIYKDDEAHPHTILAKLNAPIYVNASPDNLLRDALIHAGKKPLTVFSIWKNPPPVPVVAFDEDWEELELETDKNGHPKLPRASEEKPWVYHVLGHWEREESLVLTEDDYFDFLVRVGRNPDLIPKAVSVAVGNAALMFLGFQLTDWSFRVLFRLIMSQEGNAMLGEYCHAAVQVNPDGNNLGNLEDAKEYLKDDFNNQNISIYWGSGQDFLKELKEHLD